MPFDKTLSNGQVSIRPIALADVTQRYIGWLNDPLVSQYLETRFVEQSEESVREFVHNKIESENEFLMAICLTQGNIHIGNIKLGPINRYHSRGDLSLFLGDRRCWGKGFASIAIKLMLDEAFHRMTLNKVTAGIYQNNTASFKAFKSNGFTQEGLLENHFLCNGQMQNAFLMGLTIERYQEGRGKYVV